MSDGARSSSRSQRVAHSGGGVKTVMSGGKDVGIPYTHCASPVTVTVMTVAMTGDQEEDRDDTVCGVMITKPLASITDPSYCMWRGGKHQKVSLIDRSIMPYMVASLFRAYICKELSPVPRAREFIVRFQIIQGNIMAFTASRLVGKRRNIYSELKD
jgi:hypothetical protein